MLASKVTISKEIFGTPSYEWSNNGSCDDNHDEDMSYDDNSECRNEFDDTETENGKYHGCTYVSCTKMVAYVRMLY